MTEAVAEVVTRIIAEQARIAVEDVRMTAAPEDLGLDSLGLVEVVFAIEEAFDIQVPFNPGQDGPQVFDRSTVGSLIAAVQALVAAKG